MQTCVSKKRCVKLTHVPCAKVCYAREYSLKVCQSTHQGVLVHTPRCVIQHTKVCYTTHQGVLNNTPSKNTPCHNTPVITHLLLECINNIWHLHSLSIDESQSNEQEIRVSLMCLLVCLLAQQFQRESRDFNFMQRTWIS